MNAGYWRLRGIPVRGEDLAANQPHDLAALVRGEYEQHQEEDTQVQIRYPRTFGYMYRPV